MRRLRGRSVERAGITARTVVDGVPLVVGGVFDFNCNLSDRLMELNWVSVGASIEGRATFYPESGVPDKKSGGEFQGRFFEEGPFLEEGTMEAGSANKNGGGQLRSMSGRGFADASSPKAGHSLFDGGSSAATRLVVQQVADQERSPGLRHEAARRATRTLYSQAKKVIYSGSRIMLFDLPVPQERPYDSPEENMRNRKGRRGKHTRNAQESEPSNVVTHGEPARICRGITTARVVPTTTRRTRKVPSPTRTARLPWMKVRRVKVENATRVLALVALVGADVMVGLVVGSEIA
ncbi:hypothetical protein C8R47DRAFT_1082631 [Mycena vitilis]|nr:hypothetical protein C8R47DRAFT_1082631 [Mycena vitilis]